MAMNTLQQTSDTMRDAIAATKAGRDVDAAQQTLISALMTLAASDLAVQHIPNDNVDSHVKAQIVRGIMTLRNPPFQPPVSTMAAEFHKRLMLKNHAASPLASAPTPAPEITPLVPPPNIITPAMLRAAKSDMLATPGISARAHGHNGLEPGAWFPDRLHALSAGAHGSTMAGIYGAGESGAFSIVANDGTGYESVDQDRGDRMKYSGSTGSGTSTSYLYDSLRTGQPVRVIRGARCRTWGPSCGYRYDGLYDVVRVNEEQPTPVFDLRRRGDQESLESICRRSPTAAQRTAWDTWDAEKRGTSTREAWR